MSFSKIPIGVICNFHCFPGLHHWQFNIYLCFCFSLYICIISTWASPARSGRPRQALFAGCHSRSGHRRALRLRRGEGGVGGLGKGGGVASLHIGSCFCKSVYVFLFTIVIIITAIISSSSTMAIHVDLIVIIIICCYCSIITIICITTCQFSLRCQDNRL